MANLRPTATQITPLEGYHLLITFDNGEIRNLDVNPYIKGNWYGKLRDKKLFATVKPNGYTVVWEDGQDLCPDDVYYTSELVGKVQQ